MTSERAVAWLDWVDQGLLVELLGTVGLTISVLPLAGLMFLRAWTGLPGFVVASLILPPVALIGCILCAVALGLMGKNWIAGWGRAVLGLMFGAGVLGYWAIMVLVSLGI
jgi:hypothetical protein